MRHYYSTSTNQVICHLTASKQPKTRNMSLVYYLVTGKTELSKRNNMCNCVQASTFIDRKYSLFTELIFAQK